MAAQDQRHDSSSSPQDHDQVDDRRPRKKRQRNFTAEDRAAHRVFERCRREAFKERLVTLSNLIPAITGTDPNRLSKHVVLDESVSHIQHQQMQIQSLLDERDALIAEVNEWRSSAGLDPRLPTDDTTSHCRQGGPPSAEDAHQTQSEPSSIDPDAVPAWALLNEIDLDLDLGINPHQQPLVLNSIPGGDHEIITNDSGLPQDEAASWLNPSDPPLIIPPEHGPRMTPVGHYFP